MLQVFTIGFTKKSASRFFNLLRDSSTKRLLDVRLNKTSQLAGFAKREDLKFFLKEICDIEYIELPDLAPEAGLLRDYRNGLMEWKAYESTYIETIAKRSVERRLDPELIANGCLLCSEHQPHFCHRRVAVEYLNTCWNNALHVTHLL